MFEARIQTVAGTVPVSSVEGPVLPWETLRADTRWGVGVESDPERWLDEEGHVTAELTRLNREFGLSLIVDHTGLGMGRDTTALTRMAAGSRVAIVAATGFGAEPFAGELINRAGVDDLTGDLLREIGVGLDGTSARPGLIIAAAHDETPTPAEERATVAAARASLRTDLPVAASGLALLETLLHHRVPPQRVNVRTADPLAQRKICETGAYVTVTCPDDVFTLLDAGHGERVLFTSGVSRRDQLGPYGGEGYAKLFDVEGVPDLVTRVNPVRWLAGGR
ncbi:aryldialkylphosphatase [Herbidospora sp. NBRC 101105]|uniref:phosphotriesterase family protein n=1 Tax=Herbidospora sp. NBRC 101105 TaxID=3032195 RepID=UPI0024A12420|nr:aryldialkylphosphatase [Herbidospora sp. NBRC 101105]GLX98037.1 hypothetical protein Hesp01_59870 [Herbidospora sp. NBRC 101105]